MKRLYEYLMAEGLSMDDGMTAFATLLSFPLPIVLMIFSYGYFLIFLGIFLLGVAAIFFQRKNILRALRALTKFVRENIYRATPA